jgi:hypothetical protein
MSARTLLVTFAIVGLSCTAQDGPTTGELPESPEAPAGHILFSRIVESGEFLHFVVSHDGSGEVPFAAGREFEARTLSPDGTRLAIVAPNDQGLIVGGTVGVDGTGFDLFTNADQTLNLACGIWRSTNVLACEGWDDSDPSRAGIYVVTASDGSDPRRLTRHRDIPCDYSPDGTQLAFVRTGADDARGRLMVMDAAGGPPRSLGPEVALSGIACDWAPDGDSILIAGSDGRLSTVTLAGETTPIEGGGLDGYAWGAVWSPDGAQILFSMSVGDPNDADVYTAAADGSDLHQITDSQLLEEAANWLP